MSTHTPNFKGFPTDNSSSTNLKYDIVASKFMTGVRNHQMRTAPAPSFGVAFVIIGAVSQMVLALLVMLAVGIRWICKQDIKKTTR